MNKEQQELVKSVIRTLHDAAKSDDERAKEFPITASDRHYYDGRVSGQRMSALAVENLLTALISIDRG